MKFSLDEYIFVETQRLWVNPIALICLVLVTALISWAAWRKKASSVLGLPFLIMFYILVFYGGLHVRVDAEEIYIRWFPFEIVTILKQDIVEAHIRSYDADKEFRGWGIKTGAKGRSYTISGKTAVVLDLVSGEQILIGTQRPQAFFESVKVGLTNREKKL